MVAVQHRVGAGRIGWVVAAGFAAGAAIAVKQTGLATLVGTGLGVLAIHQHREGASQSGVSDPQPADLRGADPFVIVLLGLATLVPLGIMVGRGPLSGEALSIAVPILAVLVALGLCERELGRSADRVVGGAGGVAGSRRRLLREWGALLGGAAVAPAALVALYAARGALPALIEANTAGTLRTVNTIAEAMSSALTMLAYAVPVWVVATAFTKLPRTRLTAAAALVAAVGCGLLAMQFTAVYLGIWNAAQLLVPATAVAVALGRDRMRREDASATVGVAKAARDPVILALAAAMALQTINQLPYGAPNYFAYVAPLAVLLGAGVVARGGYARRAVFAVALLLAFGGWFNRIGYVGTAGRASIWWDNAQPLPGPHAGLLVTAADSAQYTRLTELVALHGGPDRFVAGPELISLYALAGTRRVVAQPYLLAPDALADSGAMAAAVDTSAIRAVAINHTPTFLPVVTTGALAWLTRAYPNVERVGAVEFRWR